MNGQEIFLENEERYVLMMGETVAITWNAREVSKSVYPYRSWEKEGKPYIDFVNLRQDGKDGSYYEDEDSPVVGGIDTDYARKLISELTAACEWLKNNQ